MESLQHTSYLAICFIYKAFSLVAESSESMDLMHIYPILHPAHEIHGVDISISSAFSSREGVKRVEWPHHSSLAELSYHGISDSPDSLCIRVAQVHQWMAVIHPLVDKW